MSKNYRTEELKEREQRLNKEVNTIAQRLYEARKDSGLTQAALADFAGLSESTIKRYEHGEGDMTIQTIFRIASALNLDLSEITSDRKYLLSRYDYLPKQEQSFINDLINKCYQVSKGQK